MGPASHRTGVIAYRYNTRATLADTPINKTGGNMFHRMKCRNGFKFEYNIFRPYNALMLSVAVIAFSLLVPGQFQIASAAQKVRLATLNWAPYIGENLNGEGYAAEVIRTAFERGGYQVEFFYMPWQRAVKTVMAGSYDGLAPAYYTEKRAVDFSMSEAFPGGPMVFAKRADREIAYDRLEGLKPYKIALVRGYVNTKEFDEADYLTKNFTDCDRTGYRRVLSGSVDLWLVDRFVAQTTMAMHMPERAKEIDFVAKPLAVKNLHVAFSRMKPKYAELTRTFNKGLAEVLSDGTLQQILARHGLSLE
jgi:polar amino acid transport system substrate-binding protein